MSLTLEAYLPPRPSDASNPSPLAAPPRAHQGTNPHWSDQLVRFLHQTLNQLSSPSFYGPMMAAQGAFGLGRWGLLKIFSPQITAKALLFANGAAFTLEGLAFAGTAHGLSTLTEHKKEETNFAKELGHAYLTMALLRSWGGLLKAAPHVAATAGVFTSHTLAPYLGLGQYMEPMDRFIQSVVTTFHFGMANHVLHQIPGYTQFHQQIQMKTQAYLESAKNWGGAGMGPPWAFQAVGASGSPPVENTPMDFSVMKIESTKNPGTPPPQGPPRGMFKLNTQDEVNQILHTFLTPQPSLIGRHFIPKLTDERILQLEEIFEKGGRIADLEGRTMLVELPSGSFTASATFNVAREDIVFYWLWKNYFGFPEGVQRQLVKFWGKDKEAAAQRTGFQKALETWGKIQRKANSVGIKISQHLPVEGEILKFGGQLQLIHHLLELLPSPLLKTPKLHAINLLTERQRELKLSAFTNNELFLYYGTFQGSRRNLAGMFLQGLGYATGDRYLLDERGDPYIAPATRQKMHHAHQIISQNHAMIGLDHAGGTKFRKNYQEENLEKFIAELHLIYVAAGPLLRQHIASFPKDSPVGAAWNFVYQELRDRIFAGREYDYSSSIKINSNTRPEPLWNSPLSKDFTSPMVEDKIQLFQYLGGRYRFMPPDEGSEIILGRHHFSLSRASKNISSRHIKLFRFEDFYFVQDLGSKNGTKIIQSDGTEILLRNRERNPTFPYPIMRGDRISLGGVEIELDFLSNAN